MVYGIGEVVPHPLIEDNLLKKEEKSSEYDSLQAFLEFYQGTLRNIFPTSQALGPVTIGGKQKFEIFEVYQAYLSQ